ncbi:uncharacterized protein DUF4136 [Thermoflavifilum aggregans]|uniref:Uncharacterized protein DUF4136 n=1 Tax=Thermoflavifilum aggregans TaxID=454188 RepID=A0A2M9CUC4_9BACT|nr:DUF4136 domain-containing protein [Thermoflavifilum aggregans]PJJ75514.1 uncharacterized protein DUF4136 [Thermoflavifilum aggregans]
MKHKILKMPGLVVLAIAGLTGLWAGCQKDPMNNLTLDETRLYITNYDTTAQFSTYKTFSIVDSVALVSNTQGYNRELTPADQELIQKIISLMQARGYTLVDKSQNPDLAINVTKVSNLYTGVSIYPGYWDNPLYGYWDPFYWGYYGYSYYFPPTYTFYQVSQTYYTIDMLDLKNAAQNNNQIKVIWNAQIRGEAVDDPSAVDTEIQAVFDQSPYLKAN